MNAMVFLFVLQLNRLCSVLQGVLMEHTNLVTPALTIVLHMARLYWKANAYVNAMVPYTKEHAYHAVQTAPLCKTHAQECV